MNEKSSAPIKVGGINNGFTGACSSTEEFIDEETMGVREGFIEKGVFQ